MGSGAEGSAWTGGLWGDNSHDSPGQGQGDYECPICSNSFTDDKMAKASSTCESRLPMQQTHRAALGDPDGIAGAASSDAECVSVPCAGSATRPIALGTACSAQLKPCRHTMCVPCVDRLRRRATTTNDMGVKCVLDRRYVEGYELLNTRAPWPQVPAAPRGARSARYLYCIIATRDPHRGQRSGNAGTLSAHLRRCSSMPTKQPGELRRRGRGASRAVVGHRRARPRGPSREVRSRCSELSTSRRVRCGALLARPPRPHAVPICSWVCPACNKVNPAGNASCIFSKCNKRAPASLPWGPPTKALVRASRTCVCFHRQAIPRVGSVF